MRRLAQAFSKKRCWLAFALAFLAGCQACPPVGQCQRTITAGIHPPVLSRESGASLGDIQQTSAWREAEPESPNTSAPKVIPISLDTVFRLAQDRNGQIQIARAKLNEAYLDHGLAKKAWVPELFLGMGGYRHEGGIQDEDGRLIRSSFGALATGLELRAKVDWRDVVFKRFSTETKVWMQRGEVQRLTNEQLLEASNVYFDMLTTYAGLAISEEIERKLVELQDQTLRLVKVDSGLKVEAARVAAEVQSHRIMMKKLKDGAFSASAKLKYLLGLDQCVELVPAETHFAIVHLVDANEPISSLVDRALTQGPGVHELTGLLASIERMRCQADSSCKWYLPDVDMAAGEGLFAAGRNSTLSSSNRFDIGVHLKWNLTEALLAKEKRRQIESRIEQVQLTFHDLQQKLTMGVYEARGSIQSNLEQMKDAEHHMKLAEESYKLSHQRLRENIKGRSPSEVLLALRSLGMARLEYLQNVRAHDKAQVRLFMLVGCLGCNNSVTTEPLPSAVQGNPSVGARMLPPVETGTDEKKTPERQAP